MDAQACESRSSAFLPLQRFYRSHSGGTASTLPMDRCEFSSEFVVDNKQPQKTSAGAADSEKNTSCEGLLITHPTDKKKGVDLTVIG